MRVPSQGERWGILGGAFDPVHLGHTGLASEIYRRKSLDGILLVPTAEHPVKKHRLFASFEDRLRMLELAIKGQSHLTISTIERDLSLSGYTLDTVRSIKAKFPQTEFCFLIGADNLDQIDSWHRPDEIIREIHVIAGARPHFAPDNSASELTNAVESLETATFDISSTDVRDAIRRRESDATIDRLIDRSVREYIMKTGLYL